MGKEHSPNYPAVSLNEAIHFAQALWDKEKRTTVPMKESTESEFNVFLTSSIKANVRINSKIITPGLLRNLIEHLQLTKKMLELESLDDKDA